MNTLANNIVVYSKNEFDTLVNCVDEYLGKIDGVLHEVIPQDIRVDILVSKPTKERDYYILTTCGLGAYKMGIEQADRAELVLFLSADTVIDSDSWPVRLLKTLAHLPIDTGNPIAWGHSISLGNSFPEIGFQAVVLSNTLDKDFTLTCTLSQNKKVVFYRVLPIYKNELEYKKIKGMDALIDLLGIDAFAPINLNRKNYNKNKLRILWNSIKNKL